MTHGPLGVHITISPYKEGLREVKEFGVDAVQLFTHNPRGWQFKELDEAAVTAFTQDLRGLGVKVIASHCNYLINLGTTGEIREKSLDCLRKEYAYAKAFDCDHFVLHVGKYKDATLTEGIANVAAGINETKKELLDSGVTLLLETVAGQGTEIGARFDDLAKIFDQLDDDVKPHVGVCMDTCHVFAAGYDLRTKEKVDFLVTEAEETFGWSRVKLLHLNDSLKGLGEHRDRHAHIGEGGIGEAGFAAFLNHPKLKPLPKILETPDDGEKGYAENLEAVRKLQEDR